MTGIDRSGLKVAYVPLILLVLAVLAAAGFGATVLVHAYQPQADSAASERSGAVFYNWTKKA